MSYFISSSKYKSKTILFIIYIILYCFILAYYFSEYVFICKNCYIAKMNNNINK